MHITLPVSIRKKECLSYLRSVRDVLDLRNGKLKIPIIIVLLAGPGRFNELKVEIKGISAKMLSKELKDLEVNELVKREGYKASRSYPLRQAGLLGIMLD